jgi:hypothetical protein
VSISTAGGQVAVYKPDIAPLAVVTTAPEPPVVPYQYQPALFDVGQPAAAVPQPPPPPVRRLSLQQQPDHRLQQQLPTAQQPNSKANSRANSRPLLYNKRRPSDGGEAGLSQVSRPFEYISKLSSFLSDRVFSSGDSNRRLGSNRADSTARPQLIRRRVPQPTHR